jgi:hypothetical protein
MRAVRIIAAIGLASVGLVTGASAAIADGGAYLELDRTHYLPGQTAVARAYVSVPRREQELLDRGPFSAFLVTGRAWPQEGKPLPDDVIRLGTFSIEHDRGTTFELIAHLSIPDVPGDFYSIAVCNDPCTVAGFREPITGFISIVQTAREAVLLRERQRVEARLAGARADLRRSEKELGSLRAEFDAREADRAYLAGEVNRLNHALERAREASSSGPLVDVRGAAVAVAALLAAVVVVWLGRRRRPPAARVPDTPASLVGEEMAGIEA